MATYKKILITGAGGFLGSRLVEALSAQGETLRATARGENRRAELEAFGAEFVLADLRDANAVEKIMRDCDAVVHCAAKSSPWGPYREFYDANILATEHLLEAAKQAGIRRFVHISTPSIYFDYRDRKNIRESDPLPERQVNHYSATKLISEQRVFASGLPAVALRPRAIIGRGDTVIMPRLLKAYRENRLRRIGSGQNEVSITPVLNVAEAVKCSLYAPENALGKAYNITGGEPVRLWEMIDAMLVRLGMLQKPGPLPYGLAMAAARGMEWFSRISGKEPALVPYSVGILARDMTLNIDLAREYLRFRPIQSVAEGMEEFATWWERGQI